MLYSHCEAPPASSIHESITDHIYNRPSRVYYHIAYKGLDQKFIREYCEDALEDKAFLPSILEVFEIFSGVNFDMVQTVIDEVNFNKIPATELIQDLNISPSNQGSVTYEIVSLTKGGKAVELNEKRWRGNIFNEEIDIYARKVNPIFSIGDFQTKYDGAMTFTNSENYTLVLKEKTVATYSPMTIRALEG